MIGSLVLLRELFFWFAIRFPAAPGLTPTFILTYCDDFTPRGQLAWVQRQGMERVLFHSLFHSSRVALYSLSCYR